MMSLEIIHLIEEYSNPKWDGYRIVTNEQEIFFVIRNNSNCCEEWGYLSTPDDLSEFVGAQLIDIDQIDENYNLIEKLVNAEISGSEEVNTTFINIRTNRGLLQLVAYNAHNGYYGHRVTIKSNQFSDFTSV